MKEFGNIKLENQNEFQKTKTFDLTKRFNRWHDKQHSLLTFLINLFFTISIATVGFVVNNLNKKLFDDEILNSYCLGKLAALILIISIISGVTAMFCRLYDFKYTKAIIKYRKRKFRVQQNLKYEAKKEWTEKFCLTKINKYQKQAKCLGKLTWIFFYGQVISYLIALILIVLNL